MKLTKRQKELIDYMRKYQRTYITSYLLPGSDGPESFFFRSRGFGLPYIDLHSNTVHGLIRRGIFKYVGDSDYELTATDN